MENYWKKRCALAENFIMGCPIEHKEHVDAFKVWIDFLKVPNSFWKNVSDERPHCNKTSINMMGGQSDRIFFMDVVLNVYVGLCYESEHRDLFFYEIDGRLIPNVTHWTEIPEI